MSNFFKLANNIFNFIKKYWLFFAGVLTTSAGLLIYALSNKKTSVTGLLGNDNPEIDLEIERAVKVSTNEKKLKQLIKKREQVKKISEKKSINSQIKKLNKQYAKYMTLLCIVLIPFFLSAKEIKGDKIVLIEKGFTITVEKSVVLVPQKVFEKIAEDLEDYDLAKKQINLQDDLLKDYRNYQRDYSDLFPKYQRLVNAAKSL